MNLSHSSDKAKCFSRPLAVNSSVVASPAGVDGLEVCPTGQPSLDLVAMHSLLASHQSDFGSVYSRCQCSVCRNLRATLRAVGLHARNQLKAAPRLF